MAITKLILILKRRKLQNILEKSQKDLDEMRQKYEDIKKENTKLENVNLKFLK